MKDRTTIAVTREVVDKLKRLGKKGETYDHIVRQLLEAFEGGSEEISRK